MEAGQGQQELIGGHFFHSLSPSHCPLGLKPGNALLTFAPCLVHVLVHA